MQHLSYRARSRARVHGDLREQHKCRSEDNQEVVAQNQMLFQARVAATLGYSCLPGILTLYWFWFGVFSLAEAAVSRFRVTAPESNWLNLDNNGFGISRCSVKNKMFWAHVVSHEPGLTAVSRKTVG